MLRYNVGNNMLFQLFRFVLRSCATVLSTFWALAFGEYHHTLLLFVSRPVFRKIAYDGIILATKPFFGLGRKHHNAFSVDLENFVMVWGSYSYAIYFILFNDNKAWHRINWLHIEYSTTTVRKNVLLEKILNVFHFGKTGYLLLIFLQSM